MLLCCERPRLEHSFSMSSCQHGHRTMNTFSLGGGPRRTPTGNLSRAWYTSTTRLEIYTHLVAAIWMIVLGTWWGLHMKKQYPASFSDDELVFFLFFIGGTICYLLSTTYHVLSNHSHNTHLFCLKLDFVGILTVTAGCFPPGLWYTFPCASREVKFTWITVSTRSFLCLGTILSLSVSGN